MRPAHSESQPVTNKKNGQRGTEIVEEEKAVPLSRLGGNKPTSVTAVMQPTLPVTLMAAGNVGTPKVMPVS